MLRLTWYFRTLMNTTRSLRLPQSRLRPAFGAAAAL
jgi:hypothetical protein